MRLLNIKRLLESFEIAIRGNCISKPSAHFAHLPSEVLVEAYAYAIKPCCIWEHVL